jgi:hypothetical protein
MAIVIDRPTANDEPTAPVGTSSSLRASDAGRHGVVLSLLVALLFGAAAVHLALAPSHFDQSPVEGFGFLAAAWLQGGVGVALLMRTTRARLTAAIVVSAACIAAWVVSRTAGLPFGEHAGHAEAVTVVDGVTVAMEGVSIALAAALFASPVRRFRSNLLTAVAVVAVVALTSALLAAPGTRDHASAAHGEHEHATAEPTGGGATDASAPAGAGHDHAAGGAPTAAAPIRDLNGHEIHGVKAQDVAHESLPDKLLAPATRAELAAQLVAARTVAMQYPTVADAEANGYHLVGGAYGAGAGAHYIGFGGIGGGFDAAHPPTLIYNGVSPKAEIVGLMYLGSGENGGAPEGFAGPNDHWHRHSGVCLKGGTTIFPVDADVTEAQCTAKGGGFMAITTWMVHAWVVPGWESSAGVFSHENPNLPCADGTFDTDEIGACKGPGDV